MGKFYEGYMVTGVTTDATDAAVQANIGLYPIVTFQYSSTTLYQVSYHI